MNTINNDVNHHEEGLVESSCSLITTPTCSDFSDDSSDERLSIAMNDTKDAPVVSNLPLHQTERKQNNDLVREEFRTKQKDFEYLLENVTDMILDYYEACGRPTETQINEAYSMPHEILENLGPLSRQGGTNDDCLEDIKVCFRQNLKTMHPFFFDKLYFGSDPIGQIAELVVAVLNANTHVYHVSPVFSVMEVETIQLIGETFGFSKENIDGTMNPGGSMSNMMALLVARNEYFPHVKQKGWKPTDHPRAFTAIQSHYSINTAAMVAGMGTDNMIQVSANRRTSQMDPEALELAIRNEIELGHRPFFVNAIAGSTVMGAFDDLTAIGQICKRYGLWFHVDACWGGFLIFSSPEYQKDRFKGVELADSISFNPHKGLGMPQQCSMLITNNRKGALLRSNGSDAEYLFQRQNGDYDLGCKTLGCGRKADALKLWLSIRKHGIRGFQEIADNELLKTRRMTRLVKESSDFELVADPMGTNVCFWYIPNFFEMHPDEYTNHRKSSVHKLIHKRMKEYGYCLIQQNPLSEFGLPNFFRLALGANRTRLEDMEFLLNEVRRLGQNITPDDIDDFTSLN